MSNYANIAAGLKTVLEANISGLQAFDYPIDSANHFPVAVILPEPIDLGMMLAGNSFTGRFRVVFLIASGEASEGYHQLYEYADPTQANKGFAAAVRTDRTLNSSVDDADVVRIENIGRRELAGGYYFGFDAIVEFIKTVG